MHQPLLTTLEIIIKEAEGSWSKDSDPINGTATKHPYQSTIYRTILDYCDSIKFLYNNKNFSVIPLITRSILEAQMHLINSINDSDYLLKEERVFLDKWAKNLHEIQIPTKNDDLISEDEAEKAREKIKECIARINTLPEHDNKSSIKEKFSNAGMERVYQSRYLPLSQYTHLSPRSLEERYVTYNDHEIERIGKIPPDEKKIYYWLLACCSSLISSSIEYYKRIDHEEVKNIKIRR